MHHEPEAAKATVTREGHHHAAPLLHRRRRRRPRRLTRSTPVRTRTTGRAILCAMASRTARVRARCARRASSTSAANAWTHGMGQHTPTRAIPCPRLQRNHREGRRQEGGQEGGQEAAVNGGSRCRDGAAPRRLLTRARLMKCCRQRPKSLATRTWRAFLNVSLKQCLMVRHLLIQN